MLFHIHGRVLISGRGRAGMAVSMIARNVYRHAWSPGTSIATDRWVGVQVRYDQRY